MWPKVRPQFFKSSAADAKAGCCHQSRPAVSSLGDAFFCTSMYFTTGSIVFTQCFDSFFETALKYAMIDENSSSVAGKLGMRMPVNSSGRICSTFLKKLKSQEYWILFPSPRRDGGACVITSSTG